MNINKYDDLQILRINIAVIMGQGLLAHHGDSGNIKEFVRDAYKIADEYLKQRNPEIMNKGSKGQDRSRKVRNINPDYMNLKDKVEKVI